MSSRGAVAVMFALAAFMIAPGLSGAETGNWSVDTKAQWDAGTYSNANANAGSLVLASGTYGFYTIVHDFTTNAKPQSVKVGTDINTDPAVGESASMTIWVSDSTDFSSAPSKTIQLAHGSNQNPIDITELPAKRYMKMNITVQSTTSGNTPEIFYFHLLHALDSTPPTTGVEPARSGWLTENQTFKVNCTDQTGGSGCNQTYYKVCTQASCGPAIAGYWPFDGASSNVMQEPLNDLDGLLGGPSGSPTIETNPDNVKSGQSLGFNGVYGYMMIKDAPTEGEANNPLLNSETEFSIEMWVRPRGCQGVPYLISKWFSDTTKGDYMISLNDACKPVFTIGSSQGYSGMRKESIESSVSLPIGGPNPWSFVAVTFKSGKKAIYVNGQLAAEDSSPGQISETENTAYSNQDIYLGSDYLDDHNFFGYIDELRIYTGALSPQEIMAHYKMGEFWQTAAALNTELKNCGPLESCEYYADGVAGCSPGQTCTLSVCAYSKDTNGNIESVGSPKQTYRIDKGTPNCTVIAAAKNPATFNISVDCSNSGGAPSSMDIQNRTDGSWTNASSACTRTSSAFPYWNYTCTMSNGTFQLRSSANSTSGLVGVSEPVNTSVDAETPVCSLNSTSGTSTNNASWTCVDTGSGMSFIEAQVNTTAFVAMASPGCNVTQAACSGTSCSGSVVCNATFIGKPFRVRGNDTMGNMASWASTSGTDADGDGYYNGTGTGMDCNDTNASIKPGAAEPCDGIDNNCDNVVDDPWLANAYNLTKPCSVPGACAGVIRCNATGNGVYCDARASGFEICDNNIDDDCDGAVDETAETVNGTVREACNCSNGATRACSGGVGVCTAGTQTCVNGTWGSCADRVLGVDEVCGNNIDDDCDGQKDELDCKCVNGDTKTCGGDLGGPCRKGTTTCANGVWGVCVGEVKPTGEVCNDDIDNDCDGTTDEPDCEGDENCSNGERDGDEDGIDCGGSCPDACEPEPEGLQTWMLVAVVAVVIIAMTGLVAALGK